MSKKTYSYATLVFDPLDKDYELADIEELDGLGADGYRIKETYQHPKYPEAKIYIMEKEILEKSQWLGIVEKFLAGFLKEISLLRYAIVIGRQK